MTTQRERDHKAAHTYQQGNQWVVVSWDERRQCWQESEPRSYAAACEAVRQRREEARNEQQDL